MNRLLITGGLIMVFALSSVAQDQAEPIYRQQAGVSVGMAESGSMFGGFYAYELYKGIYLGGGLDVYMIRDARELTFYDYSTGLRYYINKENNVYLFDMTIFLKYRLFAEEMDESFRPFVTGGIGPVYGMNYPEFDQTPEGLPTKDQFAWTLGGVIGAGADISISGPRGFLGIKAQYRFIPFAETIGERKNHSMFELRFEIGGIF